MSSPQSNDGDRLSAIQAELNQILEARIGILMNAMRESEAISRQIVSAELELGRSRRMSEELEAESERIQTDLEAMFARVDEQRATHQKVVAERDKNRAEIARLESEVFEARRENQGAKDRMRQLEQESDLLRQETVDLKIKLRTLEENVARLQRLREEMLSSMSGLTSQMSRGLGDERR